MSQRNCGFDFRHKKALGYRNINEIFEQKTQLHCCETLFGDYNAKVLVLLQDAANYKKLNNLFIKTGRNPFKHDPKVDTNKNLFRFLKPYFPLGKSVFEPNSRNCGVFYANAVWLLKETVSMQGGVRTEDCDLEIFHATLNNLPKLQLIIACGKAPYDLVSTIQNSKLPKWSNFRGKGVVKIFIGDREFFFGSTFHPGKRGANWRLKYSDTYRLNGADLLEQDFSYLLDSAGFEKI